MWSRRRTLRDDDLYPCRGQSGHDLRVQVSLREAAPGLLHQGDRGDGRRVSHRDAVGGKAMEASEKALARGHADGFGTAAEGTCSRVNAPLQVPALRELL